MNKKFFAALTSAAMLLSSTGVVLAADFDEVTTETGWAPGADSTNVALNSTNFPDDALLASIKQSNKGATRASQVKWLEITPAVKDLSGLEYLTNLKTVTMQGNNNISTLDLSKNTNLTGIIVGVYTAGQGASGVFAGTNAGNNALTSVVLPESDTLKTLTIAGNKALTSLDLTSASELTDADVSANALASLNITGLDYLQTLHAEDNSINTLDASSCEDLDNLYVQNNGMYEIKLPHDAKVVNASNNKFTSLDASKDRNLTDLNVADNMLESLSLPRVMGGTLNLTISNNHLASLTAPKSGTLNITDTTGQTVYANDTDTAINLTEYDANLVVENVTPVSPTYVDKNDPFNQETGVYDLAEADSTGKVGEYTYKTGAAKDLTVNLVAASLMNRLYNPNSGEHFYTKDTHEKDVLVSLGWQDESIGWVAPTTSSVPVFRLYNPNAGDHHYTKDANERDTLVRVGWQFEGIGWYSAQPNPSTAPTGNGNWSPVGYGQVEVFREYNPNAKAAGSHNYTISEVENNALVALGWNDEGIAWWALK